MALTLTTHGHTNNQLKGGFGLRIAMQTGSASGAVFTDADIGAGDTLLFAEYIPSVNKSVDITALCTIGDGTITVAVSTSALAGSVVKFYWVPEG